MSAGGWSIASKYFSEEGRAMSVRNAPSQVAVVKTKSWDEVAESFLGESQRIQPFGPADQFSMIDTTRAAEFAAGHGCPNWTELRRKSLEDSRGKKRRARK